MTHVFINYRSGDETYAALLLDEKLCQRLGHDNVFRDNRSIELGVDFKPVLWQSLARSSVFVVVVGPKWLNAGTERPDGQRRIDDPNDFVRREIAFALQIGIHVIPILVGDTPLLRAEQLPDAIAALADKQYTRLSTRAGHNDVARVVDEIATIVARETADHATTDDSDRPHRKDFSAVRSEQQVRFGECAVALVEMAGFHELASASERARARAALRQAVDEAALESRLDGCQIVDRRSAMVLLVPAPTPPVRLVVGFTHKLNASLTARRTSEPDRPTVRVKLTVVERVTGSHAGIGEALDEAEHLLRLPLLDEVQSRARSSEVVLVLSNENYERLVRNSHLADPSVFLQATQGNGCWLHVPGYPAPPGVPAHDSGSVAQPAPQSSTVVNNRASVSGLQIIGEIRGNVIGGDYVEGDVFHVNGKAERL